MTETLYIDLWISEEDLTLDSGGVPTLCNNRISIAQDCKHALLESGLPTLLLGERSRILRNDILLQMVLLLEEDERLVPGTVSITEETLGRLLITAETVDFGTLENIEVLINE